MIVMLTIILSFAVLNTPMQAADNTNSTSMEQGLMGVEPIILKGSKVRTVLGFATERYRMYVPLENGKLRPIPFQIDEIVHDRYVLDGNSSKDNGKFDKDDELAFRGVDVASLSLKRKAVVWQQKPSLYWHIDVKNLDTSAKGFVILAVYNKEMPPPITLTPRIHYNAAQSRVETPSFHLRFNKKNKILFDSLKVRDGNNAAIMHEVFNNSYFLFNADIKYLAQIQITSDDLVTELESWKTGPVRWLARVNFFFKMAAVSLNMSMYTEISVSESSISLPTVLESPVDAKSVFNAGSGFYYGLHLAKPHGAWTAATSMEPLLALKKQTRTEMSAEQIEKEGFWISETRNALAFFFKINLGKNLIKRKAETFMQKDRHARGWLKGVKTNVGMFLDTSEIGEGVYKLNVGLQVGSLEKRHRVEVHRVKLHF